MIEFTVGEQKYRTDRKIDVFKQQNIVRRLAPLVAALVDASAGSPVEIAAGAAAAVLGNLQSLAQAVSEMKDADSDYVFKTCLAVVSRRLPNDTGWAKLTSPAGDLMYEDVDLLALYQITWRVLEENLAGFFTGLAADSAGAAAPALP